MSGFVSLTANSSHSAIAVCSVLYVAYACTHVLIYLEAQSSICLAEIGSLGLSA